MANKEMTNGRSDYTEKAAAVIGDVAGRYAKETEVIKNDLNTLKSDVSGLAQKAYEDGSVAVAEAKKQAGEKVEDLRGLGADTLKRAEEYIRAKPTQSLAIALLAGFVFSAICKK